MFVLICAAATADLSVWPLWTVRFETGVADKKVMLYLREQNALAVRKSFPSFVNYGGSKDVAYVYC